MKFILNEENTLNNKFILNEKFILDEKYLLREDDDPNNSKGLRTQGEIQAVSDMLKRIVKACYNNSAEMQSFNDTMKNISPLIKSAIKEQERNVSLLYKLAKEAEKTGDYSQIQEVIDQVSDEMLSHFEETKTSSERVQKATIEVDNKQWNINDVINLLNEIKNQLNTKNITGVKKNRSTGMIAEKIFVYAKVMRTFTTVYEKKYLELEFNAEQLAQVKAAYDGLYGKIKKCAENIQAIRDVLGKTNARSYEEKLRSIWKKVTEINKSQKKLNEFADELKAARTLPYYGKILKVTNNIYGQIKYLKSLINELNNELDPILKLIKKSSKESEQLYGNESNDTIAQKNHTDWGLYFSRIKNGIDPYDKNKKLYGKTEVTSEDIANAQEQMWDRYFKTEWGDPETVRKIKRIGPALENELLSLGFNSNTNPFLKFLKNLVLVKKIFPTEDAYNTIHDLYINDIISNEDLENSKKNIILNSQDLYEQDYQNVQWYLIAYNICTHTDWESLCRNRIIKERYFSTNASIDDFLIDLFFEPGKTNATKRTYGKTSGKLKEIPLIIREIKFGFNFDLNKLVAKQKSFTDTYEEDGLTLKKETVNKLYKQLGVMTPSKENREKIKTLLHVLLHENNNIEATSIIWAVIESTFFLTREEIRTNPPEEAQKKILNIIKNDLKKSTVSTVVVSEQTITKILQHWNELKQDNGNNKGKS